MRPMTASVDCGWCRGTGIEVQTDGTKGVALECRCLGFEREAARLAETNRDALLVLAASERADRIEAAARHLSGELEPADLPQHARPLLLALRVALAR